MTRPYRRSKAHNRNYGVLKGETSPRREEARSLKQQGLTYKQVGEHMGITRQRAQQLVAPSLVAKRIIRDDMGNKCSECGATNTKLELHHPSYKLPAVVLLCTSCHKISDAKLGFTR